MKQRNITAQAGYADLMMPRIFVVVVFLLGTIAIPKYFDYWKAHQLVPVLDSVQQEVEGYYSKNKKLPELSAIQAVTGNDDVVVMNDRIYIDLMLIDEDLQYNYLLLNPVVEAGAVVWNCNTEGELYKGDIPTMRAGVCHELRGTMEKRGFMDRALFLLQQMWVFALGCLSFFALTLIFG